MNISFLSDIRRQASLHSEIKARLKEAFGLDDDDQALADTLEGESNLQEICIKALREARRRGAYAAAMEPIITENKTRKERHELAAERIRSIVAEAMQDAGERKFESPDMTVSMRESKPKQIIDEARLPDRYKMAQVKMVPNKEAIQADIDNGIVPEGVEIANRAPVLTVRMK